MYFRVPPPRWGGALSHHHCHCPVRGCFVQEKGPPQSFGQLPLGGGAAFLMLIYSLQSERVKPVDSRLGYIVEFPLPNGEGARGRGSFNHLRYPPRAQRFGPMNNPLSRFATAPPTRGSKVSDCHSRTGLWRCCPVGCWYCWACISEFPLPIGEGDKGRGFTPAITATVLCGGAPSQRNTPSVLRPAPPERGSNVLSLSALCHLAA